MLEYGGQGSTKQMDFDGASFLEKQWKQAQRMLRKSKTFRIQWWPVRLMTSQSWRPLSQNASHSCSSFLAKSSYAGPLACCAYTFKACANCVEKENDDESYFQCMRGQEYVKTSSKVTKKKRGWGLGNCFCSVNTFQLSLKIQEQFW